LKRGARVIAVDRSPLAPPVLNHPRLTMIEGNAFTYQAPHPVDWLLSDVVCEPPRALELINRWIGPGGCRKLVVTVKFKGRAGYGFLATVRDALANLPRFRIKHLPHNKNEVTVMARLAVSPSGPG
jgi:23S rRNA (cytidine2498-2'-O)-methyltransferase